MTTKCKSCQTVLLGKFCYNCGEKSLDKNDFLIKSILSNAILNFTSFDTKILKSFKSLLFNPGRLTSEYVEGRRVGLMKPFQLFVACNLIFFMFLSSSDIFQQPSKYYFKYSEKAIIIQNKVLKDGSLSKSEFHQLYDKKVAALSKGAVVILIPFFALFFLLFNYGKKMAYGKHVIFSTHFLSFFLLFVVFIFMSSYLYSEENKYTFKIPLITGIFIYLFFSIKNFYKYSNLITIYKSGISSIFIIAIIITYRNSISALSLYLISK